MDSNVQMLIFARAFAGCGAAGIFVSVLSISQSSVSDQQLAGPDSLLTHPPGTFAVAEVTRLEDRPKLLGLFGAVFGISSVVRLFRSAPNAFHGRT